MKIIAYKLYENAMDLIPSKPTREWMDNSINKNPYRCLPLLMANSYGWSIVSSAEFVAEWNGGQRKEDITIENISGNNPAISHFGEGVLTWHTGYLFRTEFPYGIYATGSPNEIFQNVVCLSGIVETHWLPFPFTMNWRFTTPGKTRVKQGDVIAHVYPIKLDIFDEVETEVRMIAENPELQAQYNSWSQSRREFLDKPRKHTEWQKNYFKGKDLDGKNINEHFTNINAPEFKNR
jgi:hypothetical protein